MNKRINCLVAIIMLLSLLGCTGSSLDMNELKGAKIKILLGKTDQNGKASDYPELCILDLDSVKIFDLDKKMPRNPWDEAKFFPDGNSLLINMRDFLGKSGLRRFYYYINNDEEFNLEHIEIELIGNDLRTLICMNDSLVGFCVGSKYYDFNIKTRIQRQIFDMHPKKYLGGIGLLNFNSRNEYLYFRANAEYNNEVKFIGRYKYKTNTIDTIRIIDENLCDITRDGRYVMSDGYDLILSEIIGDSTRTIGYLKNLPNIKYSGKFLDNERIIITQLNRHKKERPCTFIVYNFKKDIVEQQFSIDDYYYFICDVYNANY